jgi:hypothetical protein
MIWGINNQNLLNIGTMPDVIFTAMTVPRIFICELNLKGFRVPDDVAIGVNDEPCHDSGT